MSSSHRHPRHLPISLVPALLKLRRIDLALLQHNAIHARLQKRVDARNLPLQQAQLLCYVQRDGPTRQICQRLRELDERKFALVLVVNKVSGRRVGGYSLRCRFASRWRVRRKAELREPATYMVHVAL